MEALISSFNKVIRLVSAIFNMSNFNSITFTIVRYKKRFFERKVAKLQSRDPYPCWELSPKRERKRKNGI